ncbi:hypothetical protein EJ08DRAFT_659566 [Tothia fuscella]|uniref:Uncharacterized protein n=1 Tax=Tothia fuscella TaxID=1048955 RepID=A0A9P4NV48_9PEZI|nr:hypothetical protein EJ08DRAFT_659566 [Tothia fuscella]
MADDYAMEDADDGNQLKQQREIENTDKARADDNAETEQGLDAMGPLQTTLAATVGPNSQDFISQASQPANRRQPRSYDMIVRSRPLPESTFNHPPVLPISAGNPTQVAIPTTNTVPAPLLHLVTAFMDFSEEGLKKWKFELVQPIHEPVQPVQVLGQVPAPKGLSSLTVTDLPFPTPARTSSPPIIVAFDLGTAYSSAAWTFRVEDTRKDLKDAERYRWSDPYVIDAYPGPDRKYPEFTSFVPSQIEYCSDETAYYWGLTLPAASSPESTRYLNFKMGMNQQASIPDALIVNMNQSNLHAPRDVKHASLVFTDYITSWIGYVMDCLEAEFSRKTLEETPMRFIVTVPVGWKNDVRNALRKAVIAAKAQYRPSDCGAIDEVHNMYESEAAARHVLKYMLQNQDNGLFQSVQGKKRTILSIFDCSGATVDGVVYDIIYRDNKAPMLHEIIRGGRTCGSVFMNGGYYDWLCKTFPGFEPVGDWSKEFDKAKEAFDVDVLNDEAMRDMEGIQQVSTNPTVAFIKELNTAAEVPEHGGTVEYTMMAGGYGESSYLRRQVELAYQERNLEIGVAPKNKLAVVLGALDEVLKMHLPDDVLADLPCLDD